MPTLLVVKALVMSIVEGFTEFLPVSSTGHLILIGALLDFDNEKGKAFEIVIQTGAMLAIVWEYRVKLYSVLKGLFWEHTAQRFALNVAVAFMPAALVGLALGRQTETYLFRPVPVAIAFIGGGVVIMWAERRKHAISVPTVELMTWRDALKVGCAQCLALIPGTSRSGATIIGGLLFGLSRKAAAEFSFFLAIPTLMAAGAYKLFSVRALLSSEDLGWFAVGLFGSFVSALLCVRWLLRYISRHDFVVFAWYRVALGIVVIVTAYFGTVQWRAQ